MSWVVADNNCRRHSFQPLSFITEYRGYWQLACKNCLADIVPERVCTLREQEHRLKNFIRENMQLQYLQEMANHFKASIDQVVSTMMRMLPDEQKLEDLRKKLTEETKDANTILEFTRSREYIEKLEMLCHPQQHAREELIRIMKRSCNDLLSIAKLDQHYHPMSREALYSHRQISTVCSNIHREHQKSTFNSDLQKKYEEQISRLYDLLTASEQEYMKYKLQSTTINDSMEELRKANEELRKAKEENTRLKEYSATTSRMNVLLQKRNGEIEQNLKTKINELEETVRAKTKEYEELKHYSLTLIYGQQAEFEKLERAFHMKTEYLKNTLDYLNKLSKVQIEHEKTQSELRKKYYHIKKGVKQQKALTAELDYLKQKLNGMEGETQKKVSELTKKIYQQAKYMALQTYQDRKKLEQSQATINLITDRLEAVGKELELSQRNGVKAYDTCTELKRKLEEKIVEGTALSEKTTLLYYRIAELSTQHEPLERYSAQIKAANEQLQRYLTETKTYLSATKQQLSKITTDLYAMKIQKTKVEGENTKLKNDLRYTKDKLNQLERESFYSSRTRQSTIGFDESSVFDQSQTSKLNETQRTASTFNLSEISTPRMNGPKPTTAERGPFHKQPRNTRIASFIEPSNPNKQDKNEDNPPQPTSSDK